MDNPEPGGIEHAAAQELQHARDQLKLVQDELQEQRQHLEALTTERSATLKGVNQLFQDALGCKTEEELGKLCLSIAEELTDSAFGFLGLLNSNGLMSHVAISNPGWEACEIPFAEANAQIMNMAIRGIDRGTIRDGRSRIVNADEMATHPDRVGLPDGHPGLNCFLGVPLIHQGRTIGMIGLSNTPSGYTRYHQKSIEILAVAIAEVLQSHRRERKLQQVNLALETANRELTAFSHSVSHDLRTPLRAISAFSQILEDEFIDSLPDGGRDYFRRIRRATHQMDRLIEALLNLAQLNRKQSEHIEVDLSAVARTIIVGYRQKDPERDVTLDIEPGLRAVGDPGMLYLLLDNLLGNAWKFTRLNATARIEMGIQESVFYIRDNGAGFNIEYAAKLFGAFERLHTAEEFDGMGIGLATVQRIVERHQGRVWAESTVGEGATFYFTLGSKESE